MARVEHFILHHSSEVSGIDAHTGLHHRFEHNLVAYSIWWKCTVEDRNMHERKQPLECRLFFAGVFF